MPIYQHSIMVATLYVNHTSPMPYITIYTQCNRRLIAARSEASLFLVSSPRFEGFYREFLGWNTKILLSICSRTEGESPAGPKFLFSLLPHRGLKVFIESFNANPGRNHGYAPSFTGVNIQHQLLDSRTNPLRRGGSVMIDRQ